MWDLQGKALGLPVSELFGGRLRDSVRNYANINRATRGDERTPEGFAANARRALDAGFDAFKMASFDDVKPDPSGGAGFRKGVEYGIACIRAVREVIGPERDLLVDGHSKFTREQAIETAKQLKPLKLFWFEEAVRGIENLAAADRAAPMRTAGGESLFGVEAFYPYIAGKAVDIVMPDIKFCGGLLELKKIAAMAEGAGLTCAPHGPASPIGNMAAAQVCSTLPNFEILEFAHGEVDWRGDSVTPEEPIRNGRLTVLDRPGIGYELNEKRWKRYG
jgi:galactonate dehydratase